MLKTASFQVRTEINRRIVVWRTRREMSLLSGSGGQRTKYPYTTSPEKTTSLNPTTTAALGTPDLLRHALLEIEDSSDKTFENDFQLGVKEDKDGGEEKEGDEGSGRSSLLELDRDSRNKNDHDNADSTHF